MQDSSVTELDLSDAWFGDEEVKSISELLQVSDCCITKINFGQYNTISIAGVKSIRTALESRETPTPLVEMKGLEIS